jgi:hypothetical protein
MDGKKFLGICNLVAAAIVAIALVYCADVYFFPPSQPPQKHVDG